MGEGFITSIDGSKYILKQIYNDGIIFNIDDQLEICCKNHKYLPDTPFTLMIETNQGDCLKTKEISNNEILKLKSLTITSFLNSRGFNDFEGNCQGCQHQIEDLIFLTKNSNINVMEIGFNAGHSAEVFLSNNHCLNLTSFDLGEHNYGPIAKEYIDFNFPNRHTLIFGDSRQTVPSYIENNKDIKFDVIFIDGGHDYEIARNDLENCFHLAHKDTIVILDDVVFKEEWKEHYTQGPTRIWNEYLEKNKIIELNRKEYSKGRGMSWGKYKICT
jgi:predicted O-methyltransferase YrrM